MNLDAVPHRQRHRAIVDATLVAAHAVAVPERIAAQPLAIGFELGTQRSPTFTAVHIGPDRISGTIARSKRWQLDQLGLPALQQVPLLLLTIVALEH